MLFHSLLYFAHIGKGYTVFKYVFYAKKPEAEASGSMGFTWILYR